MRWVDPATTHVTLHFFAELPPERTAAVVDAVGGVVSGQAPFALQPGGYGSFPRGARARVLWLGLGDESGALAGLAAGVADALAGRGFEVDPRPFRSHITLGRPGPRFDLQAWGRELAEPVELPAFTAREVLLYESRNGHHVRERLPFGLTAGGAGDSTGRRSS